MAKCPLCREKLIVGYGLQDITPVEDIRQNPKCDREIAVYGYLRGTKLKGQARVHIAGVGDTTVSSQCTIRM